MRNLESEAVKFIEGLDRESFDAREIHNDFDGCHDFEHETDQGMVIFTVQTACYFEEWGMDYSMIRVSLVDAYDTEEHLIQDLALLDEIEAQISYRIL